MQLFNAISHNESPASAYFVGGGGGILKVKMTFSTIGHLY